MNGEAAKRKIETNVQAQRTRNDKSGSIILAL